MVSGLLEKAKLIGADLHAYRRIILIRYEQYKAEELGRLWQYECPEDLFVRWGNERILINHEANSASKTQLIKRSAPFSGSLSPPASDGSFRESASRNHTNRRIKHFQPVSVTSIPSLKKI